MVLSGILLCRNEIEISLMPPPMVSTHQIIESLYFADIVSLIYKLIKLILVYDMASVVFGINDIIAGRFLLFKRGLTLLL